MLIDGMFESPLERDFYYGVINHLDRAAKIEPQVEVATLCGRFRLDFLLTVGGERIGLECDGENYHDFMGDEWRDAMILGDGQATQMIRFAAADLCYAFDDCLYFLSRWVPWAFSVRNRIVMEGLASDKAKGADFDACGALYAKKLDGGFHTFFIHRRSLPTAGDALCFRQRWQAFYEYAKKRGGGDLEGLMCDHAREQDAATTPGTQPSYRKAAT